MVQEKWDCFTDDAPDIEIIERMILRRQIDGKVSEIVETVLIGEKWKRDGCLPCRLARDSGDRTAEQLERGYFSFSTG
jgi:hypothetical protein